VNSSFREILGGSFSADRIELTRRRDYSVGRALEAKAQAHEVRVMELQDQQVREALIAMGWTPPDTRAACTCSHNTEEQHMSCCPRY
jgi:hypothetical protein